MSTSDSLVPHEAPDIKPRKRSRFAGERFGAWMFAASFSLGIWGLALKVMTPTHRDAEAASASRHAILAPSAAGDGRATVVWAADAPGFYAADPVIEAIPITHLDTAGPPDPTAR